MWLEETVTVLENVQGVQKTVFWTKMQNLGLVETILYD
jgi:hypothetical protein